MLHVSRCTRFLPHVALAALLRSRRLGMHGVASVVVTMLLCGWGLTPAQAVPITFSFTGTGSGTLNTTSFSDAAFEVVIAADTDNVETTTFGTDTPVIIGLSGVITITGIGTGSFLAPLYVFDNQGNQAVGFGNFVQSDLINIIENGVGLNTYDLRSSFGPLFETDPFFGQFTNVALNIGNLTFTSMPDVIFTATTTAAPIPEPSTWLLMGSGCVGLLGYGWRQRKQASKERRVARVERNSVSVLRRMNALLDSMHLFCKWSVRSLTERSSRPRYRAAAELECLAAARGGK